MKEFKHKGVEYELIDLNSAFTLRQQKIARKFMGEILSELTSNPATAELKNKLDKYNGKKLTQKEKNEIESINMQISKMMFDYASDSDIELNVLALVYLPKKDKNFTEEGYQKRLKEFDNLQWDDSFNEVIENFTNGKMPSLMKSFLTSIKAITAVKKIA